jgi:hypothetical protein
VPHHYFAARYAVMAAAGKGQDADTLAEKEKTALRQQALSWLQAELTHLQQQLQTDAEPASKVQAMLSYWQKDANLDAVRDAKALAELPEKERQDWQQLWAEVNQLLQKAKMAKKGS